MSYIYVKKSPGIRDVFIPADMVLKSGFALKKFRFVVTKTLGFTQGRLRVLSATFILSKNSRALDAKSRLISAKIS